MKNFLVFDLETQKSAEEVGGWGNKHLMKVSVAVIYDSGSSSFEVFPENKIDELVERLLLADLVVGFNIKSFDWKVLGGYRDIDFARVNDFDILEDIQRILGHRLSLEHLARATLNAGKSGDGLLALNWFRQGKLDKVIEYCKDDVDITRRLYEYGRDRGYVLFKKRDGNLSKVPVSWPQ